MKFIANENIPIESIQLLQSSKIDIISIQEIKPGISDLDVIDIARNEDRIIITFDKDYGELIYQRKISFKIGIIFLRFIPKNSLETGKILIEILNNSNLDYKNKFTVIDREKIRQRNL
jgi:predicted nuclease of predicted toxin-antitoxin system